MTYETIYTIPTTWLDICWTNLKNVKELKVLINDWSEEIYDVWIIWDSVEEILIRWHF